MPDPGDPTPPRPYGPGQDPDATVHLGRSAMPGRHSRPEPDAERTDVLPVVPAAPAAPDPVDPAPEAEPMAEESPVRRKRPGWLIPVIAAAALVLLVAGAYLVDLLRTSGEIEAGTTIGHVDVGGLTPEQARERLATEAAGLQQPFSVQAHGETLTLDPVAAGLDFDIAASVAAAGTRSANPVDRVRALFGTEQDLPLIATVDETALTTQLEGLAAESDVTAVEGVVELTGNEVSAIEPVTGRLLDVPGSADLISAAWLSGNPATAAGIELPVDEQPVRATIELTREAVAELDTLLSGPVILSAAGTEVGLPIARIAAAITVVPDEAGGWAVTIDEASLIELLLPQLQAVETQPADASIGLVDGAPKITPGVDGRTLDRAATTTALADALRGSDRRIDAAYTVTEPGTTTAEVEALGIREVVSEFTTGGFAYDSGQNVRIVAEEVQGAIVLPGETFSLNTYTGRRSEAEGYVEAGILENGRPARAVGGGISQFATTTYNAAYFAGMEDVDHQAHSIYISRYPEGREATVFQNPDGSSVIDLAFKNNFETAVLIQTIWTESDITVRFWGTKTVEVESITGERYDFTAAPEVTIPYGESCSPTGGSSGFTVDNTRIVRDLAGKEIERNEQSTSYNGSVKVICEPAPVTSSPSAPSAPPPATTPAG
ncbi:vanomycin resistance protein VanB [Nakamurella sp. YIM 132087]|uniref:Vanomycin resistance protein VanB n=1 Tax=Nakamurella alba TaxID=2665158 RepID=A0A7K1FFX5_9ACTN|nr:VanW family protein [Nakamurella alba]MTD13007.1 vanomycin resistance protein VanB [Nakamurella alba]